MLLVSERNIILKKRYQKVLNVLPALNQTFCFLGMRGHRQDCVVHVDKDGNILFQHVFDNIMDAFGMLSERECILLQTRKNFITFLDLESHKFRKVPFNFMNEETDQSFIHTFADTKYLCIRENGRFNDNRFKLSYFHYPLQDNAKPFKVFFSQEDWTYQYIVRKTNNHSQFAWFKGRHDENIEIYVYDLRKVQEGRQIQKYSFKNRIGEPYGIHKVQCALKTMWQVRPDQFMLVCDTDRNKPEGDKVNNNYILDVRTGLTRESKFKTRQSLYQQLMIDQKYMGSTSMFRTFNFQNGQPLQSPVYYVDNQTEEILDEEKWKCTYKTKYQFPGYDGAMICQSEYENGDVEQIKVMMKKITNPRQIYLHFMLELNPDFDRDLLEDVVEMIDYSK